MHTPASDKTPRNESMRNWVLVPIVTSLLLTVAAVVLLLANR